MRPTSCINNTMAALARHPETPDGVDDRWRIDEIDVVEDGAIAQIVRPVRMSL